MKALKGCVNETCPASKEKPQKNEDENACCEQCGETLVYVCKRCHTQLPDDSKRYCIRCEAKRADRKDKILDGARHVSEGIAGIGALIILGDKTGFDLKDIFKFKR